MMLRQGLIFLLVAAASCSVTVELPNGSALVGAIDPASGVSSFFGVNYSAPVPRWTQSSLVEIPSDAPPMDATRFGPACPQYLVPSLEFPPGIVISEQCLNLNVWVPPRPASNNSPLPVFFWIHGGAFMLGGGAEEPYWGVELAAQHQMIVVTINYRLGQLGFLALPEMRDSQRGAFGLGDQRVALQWVQQNIAGFGGDPTRVTIGGQSAGASSVAYLLRNRDAWSLFSRAYVGSGAPAGEIFSEAQAFASASEFLGAAGCAPPTLECALQLPVENLLQHQQVGRSAAGQRIVLQLPKDPAHIAPVPLMFGNTANELLFSVLTSFPDPVSPAEYPAVLNKLGSTFGMPDYSAIPCKVSDCRRLIGDILSGWFFVCDTTAMGTYEPKASYAYVFNHAPSWADIAPEMGVPHGSGLKFLFDTLPVEATAAERRLAKLYSGKFASFVMGEDAPWTPFHNNATRFVLQTGQEQEYTHHWKDHICAQIANYNYRK